MKAIDNSQVVDALCASCTCALFAPVVSYTINANSIVFTQSSTFDAGDSLKRLRCEVFDKNGKLNSSIMSGAGSGGTIGTVVYTGGVITSIPVSAGGTGYTVPPRVSITGGTGTGAVAVANINSSGVVTSVTILNGGSGYGTGTGVTVSLVTTSCEVPLSGTGFNTLDSSSLSLKAFVLSTGGCKADLSAIDLRPLPNTTGVLGNSNEQGDNNESGNN